MADERDPVQLGPDSFSEHIFDGQIPEYSVLPDHVGHRTKTRNQGLCQGYKYSSWCIDVDKKRCNTNYKLTQNKLENSLMGFRKVLNSKRFNDTVNRSDNENDSTGTEETENELFHAQLNNLSPVYQSRFMFFRKMTTSLSSEKVSLDDISRAINGAGRTFHIRYGEKSTDAPLIWRIEDAPSLVLKNTNQHGIKDSKSNHLKKHSFDTVVANDKALVAGEQNIHTNYICEEKNPLDVTTLVESKDVVNVYDTEESKVLEPTFISSKDNYLHSLDNDSCDVVPRAQSDILNDIKPSDSRRRNDVRYNKAPVASYPRKQHKQSPTSNATLTDPKAVPSPIFITEVQHGSVEKLKAEAAKHQETDQHKLDPHTNRYKYSTKPDPGTDTTKNLGDFSKNINIEKRRVISPRKQKVRFSPMRQIKNSLTQNKMIPMVNTDTAGPENSQHVETVVKKPKSLKFSDVGRSNKATVLRNQMIQDASKGNVSLPAIVRKQLDSAHHVSSLTTDHQTDRRDSGPLVYRLMNDKTSNVCSRHRRWLTKTPDYVP